MLKRYLLVLVCLLCPAFAYAQRPLTIVGGVVTANVADTNDFQVILTGNVSGVTLVSTVGTNNAPVTPNTGYQITMRFVQDATGSRTVTFGGNITSSCAINSTALAVTICRWQYTASGNTWADAGGSSSPSVGSVFSVLNYGWIDNDVTDNCGAPVTNFLAAVNGYTGPGLAQAIIPEGLAGKAYKLNSCNLVFTLPVTIRLWGTLDCGTGISLANCIQLGPSGQSAFSNAQIQPYTLTGGGFLTGCLNVTVACIQAPVFISQPIIDGIHMNTVGAGNATAGNCTNYAISFDGSNNGPVARNIHYWITDATTGRCFGINNRTGAGGGTNSGMWAGNLIQSAAAPGLTAPCSSVGIVERGAASLIAHNNIFGFGIPIRLGSGAINATISDNYGIDTNACTAKGVSADIHIGDAGGTAITATVIKGNYFGAAGVAVAQAGDATAGSNLASVYMVGNSTSSTGNKDLMNMGTAACTVECVIENNIGFRQADDTGQAVCLTNTASPAACGATLRGSFSVPASQTTYTVNTTAITTFAQITLQQTTDNSGITGAPTCSALATNPILASRVLSTSFTFSLTSQAAVTCYTFTIRKST